MLTDDRPYAATAMLHLDCTSLDLTNRSVIYGSLTVGVIGPVAQGREIQTAIHRVTGNFIPLGWQYQIRNDLLLNYALRYQYMLVDGRVSDLYTYARGDAGTLQCRLGVGLGISAGVPASSTAKLKPAISAGIEASTVGYDARLQGGIFNRSSPHVLRASEISRATGSAYIQLRLDYRRAGIGAEHTWLTREFKTGLSHAWGRLFVQYYF